MTSSERIGLEDLQELAESFANMKMVDLKMNTGDGALIPRGYHQVPPEQQVPQVPPAQQQHEGGPAQDVLMRAREDFHVGDQHRRERPNMNNLTGTRVRKQIPKFRDTPLGKTSLDPIHPYGLMLNIDDIDFKDIDMIIDDWSSSMRIAAGTLDLEKEGFIKLLEMSLLGVAKTLWSRVAPAVKEETLEPASYTEIVDRMAFWFKLTFLGADNFGSADSEKRKNYSQAILNLRLNNMEKESIDQFFKLYHIYQWNSDVDERVCVEIFFTKFPSPWKEMFIKEYIPGDPDNVGRRMSFVKQKLAEWCGQAILQKNYKRLKRMNKYSPLDCTANDLPTIIGGESQRPRKNKKHRVHPYAKEEFSRKRSWKPRSRWTRQKARFYKSGQRRGPSRDRTSQSSSSRTPARKTFRRAHTRANESFKDCNCWTCGARGHISIDCPEKRGVKSFEGAPDIEEAVYYQDLVQVYQFEDIPSDESIYEEEEVFSNESIDGRSDSESDWS